PVPEPVVRKIIEVSARAPSGHNIQPWKVYAIAGEVKDRLCADILKAAETEPDRRRSDRLSGSGLHRGDAADLGLVSPASLGA
ncbi:hypothetical protein KXV85_001177, partial [Aspergillus fumigatus]